MKDLQKPSFIRRWLRELFLVYDLQIIYNIPDGTYALRKVVRFNLVKHSGEVVQVMNVPYSQIETLESQWLTMSNCHKYNGRGLKNV